MSNKKRRCQKKEGENKRCQYIAEANGYCRFHQNEPIHLEFWQKQDEKQRLHYLQICAEMRAIEACYRTDDDKEADMSFNRNLRMAAAIARLRHSLNNPSSDSEKNTEDKWLTLLESEEIT